MASVYKEDEELRDWIEFEEDLEDDYQCFYKCFQRQGDNDGLNYNSEYLWSYGCDGWGVVVFV